MKRSTDVIRKERYREKSNKDEYKQTPKMKIRLGQRNKRERERERERENKMV